MTTSSKFIVSGSTVSIFKMDDGTSYDKLPPKVYSLAFNIMRGYYLEMFKDRLDVPEKIYGNVIERANKCITTYKDRDASTGILMTGDKGTGKSLLTALLANAVIEQLGLPVILVTKAHQGEAFSEFVRLIGECCFVFDEFGKMYSIYDATETDEVNQRASQQQLLSLFDGVDKTKKMFILSENSETKISEYMLNRPGRIYYHFKYRKLDENSIIGYCKDFKIDDKISEDILEVSRLSKTFSFDMLQAIVEEHLRYKEDIKIVVEELNINISTDTSMFEIVKIVDSATNEDLKILGKTTWRTSDLSHNRHVCVEYLPQGITIKEDEDETDYTRSAYLTAHNIKYEKEDIVVFECASEQVKIVTKKLPPLYQDYSDYLMS